MPLPVSDTVSLSMPWLSSTDRSMVTCPSVVNLKALSRRHWAILTMAFTGRWTMRWGEASWPSFRVTPWGGSPAEQLILVSKSSRAMSSAASGDLSLSYSVISTKSFTMCVMWLAWLMMISENCSFSLCPMFSSGSVSSCT